MMLAEMGDLLQMFGAYYNLLEDKRWLDPGGSELETG
jgi:hypothetical protein